MVKNNIVVNIKADIESCKQRDYKGVYEKALKGELPSFTGISEYMKSLNMLRQLQILLPTSIDEATKQIVKYIKENYVK